MYVDRKGQTMDFSRTDPWLLTCILSSLTLVFVYIYHTLAILRLPPQLTEAVRLILSAWGVVAGVKLCYLSLTCQILPEAQNDIVYIFIGGIATIWVSIVSIQSILLPWSPPSKV